MRATREMHHDRRDRADLRAPVRRRAAARFSGFSAKSLLVFAAVCLVAATFTPVASAARLHAEGVFGSAAQPSFGEAASVAADGHGDVLVVDTLNHTLNKFKADGTPDNFSALNSTNVIDGHAGEADEVPGLESIIGFPNNGNEVGVAVDTSGGLTGGNIYVTDVSNHVVDIFAESGKYLGRLSEYAGTPLEETCGIAVDTNGAVYVSSYGQGVVKYVPSGSAPTNGDFAQLFESEQIFGTPRGLGSIAAGRGPSAGALFVSNFGLGVVVKFNPSSGAFEGVIAEETPEGARSVLAVDPTTGRVFYSRGSKIVEVDASGTTFKTLGEIETQSVVRGLGTNAADQLYVTRSGDERVEVYGTAPVPPVIEQEDVLSATATEATVEAQVFSEGFATTVHAEYGPDSSYGSTTSASLIPGDDAVHSVRFLIQGLTPGQTYHFHFVASNALGLSEGGDHTITTFRTVGSEANCPNSAFRTGPAARLADCRAYEMVSPVEKNNIDLISIPNFPSYLTELNQSTPTGNKLTYATLGGFAGTKGLPYVAQYFASRGPDGWSNQSINSTQGIPIPLPSLREELEFQVFSPDLCTALLNHYFEPALSPGGPEGVTATYRWTGCNGEPQYETVSNIYPTGIEPSTDSPPLIQGLSADGRCGLYIPNPFEPQPFVQEKVLFETCGGQTREVSVLPDGTRSPRAEAGTLGGDNNQNQSLREGNYQGVISTDGSRIYWTASNNNGGPLYLRLNAQSAQSSLGPADECLEPTKACTIPVSVESEEALFWAASPDGSRAIYSVLGGENPGLYEFNLGTRQSNLIAGGAREVMGVSKDATRTYFLSKESISGLGIAGQLNLYLYDAPESGASRYRYIGTVSPADGEGESIALTGIGLAKFRTSQRASRVSDDGLHAVFSAYAPLTGYNNRDAVSGRRDLEVFVYDAQGAGGASSLVCASCNPSGQRPHGGQVEVAISSERGWNPTAAFVPPPATAFYASRAMSEDGSRVFFNSFDALLPTDTNGREDVYEWEAPGSGPAGAECTEASASFSPANGGCLSLVSSGESAAPSEFADAGPDGRDVFFRTAASLVPQDPGLVDIYDAREGGGFPPPPGLPPGCEGEACQGPISPPQDSTPSSATFNGPGNVKHHKKRHHKKKKRGSRQTSKGKGAGR